MNPNIPELGIEFQYINKILKELATFYSTLVNQYKINYQTVFSARFTKKDEHEDEIDENELYRNLKINRKFNRIWHW